MLGKSRNELIPFFPILRRGDIRLIPKGMQNIVCGQLPRHEAQFDKRPNSSGQQAHPLMMGHPASYQLMTCPPEPASGRTIVCSFVEAVFAEPAQTGHSRL